MDTLRIKISETGWVLERMILLALKGSQDVYIPSKLEWLDAVEVLAFLKHKLCSHHDTQNNDIQLNDT
jgi:hypothetical protein